MRTSSTTLYTRRKPVNVSFKKKSESLNKEVNVGRKGGCQQVAGQHGDRDKG